MFFAGVSRGGMREEGVVWCEGGGREGDADEV